MVSFAGKWAAAHCVFAVLQKAGHALEGFENDAAARETAEGLFCVFGVPDGSVLRWPIGQDRVLVLHNSNGGGVLGYDRGDVLRVLTYAENMTESTSDFVTTHDASRAVAREKVELQKGDRVLCFWKGSTRVALALAGGARTLQIEPGGPLLPIEDVCHRAMLIESRDQAFDTFWREGRTSFSSYAGFRGIIAGRQRKINGQRNGKGVKTAPSPKLGPAALTLPESDLKALHGPENGISGPVDPANEACIVEYEAFLVENGLLPPDEARASAERSRQNVREGRGWREDKIEKEEM